MDAVPSALLGMELRSISDGVISATLSRIQLSPGYAVPDDVVELDRLLETVGSVPNGSDGYSAQDVGDVHIGFILAQRATGRST